MDTDAGKAAGGEAEEVGTVATFHIAAVAGAVNPVGALEHARNAEVALGGAVVAFLLLVTAADAAGYAAGEDDAVVLVHDIEAHFGLAHVDVGAFAVEVDVAVRGVDRNGVGEGLHLVLGGIGHFFDGHNVFHRGLFAGFRGLFATGEQETKQEKGRAEGHSQGAIKGRFTHNGGKNTKIR